MKLISGFGYFNAMLHFMYAVPRSFSCAPRRFMSGNIL